MVTRQEVAAVLRQYAVLAEILDEDPFRARAFDNAARMLEAQTEPLDRLIAENRLAAIKGIGRGVAAAVTEVAERGTFSDLEQALAEVPPGVLELLRIEGLGPKKARALWQQAGVTNLKELETALHGSGLVALPGFGTKTVERFRASLAFLKTVSGRHWRHHAVRAAAAARAALEPMPGMREVFFGGSLRRGCETVGDLDVIVIAEPGLVEAVRRSVRALSGTVWTEEGEILRGEFNQFPIELSVVPPREAVYRKFVATGSNEHVQAVMAIAMQRGIDLAKLAVECEESIYVTLGLEPVPPALREDASTLVTAGERTFAKPVAMEDIRGILHCHTTYSDGHHTLRELAEAMIEKGYEYLGIADHSQTAAYARGLTPDRVCEQWREIDALNSELAPFRILKGTETDILADGQVDFEEELLAGFDYVVASIHSGFNMSEAEATERLCRALAHPQVDILGHPTGRLLLERSGYPVNHERLLECVSWHGKGIELNCNPHRLDLDWRWLAECDRMRVPVPLCPDAHYIEGLWDIQFGVDVAAKGPLTAANCPSTWTAEEFLSWCKSHARRT
jgi:DNA polymerase (family 10)